MEWISVLAMSPPPHARYLVKRRNILFVAIPCYGMHVPWWVPMGPSGETDPENMEDEDWWFPLGSLDDPRP